MWTTFTGGPVWSPRTIEKAQPAEEEKKGAAREQQEDDPVTINLVFDALRPFQDAYAAVIRALERQAEKERLRR